MTDREYNKHKTYLEIAQLWATLSYAKKKKVGCIIVKDKMIISDGYNGTPPGFPNECEDENGDTYWYVVHAEANAILKIARNGNNSLEGSYLYITMAPCSDCAKLIISSGIKKVFYSEPYRIINGLELLKSAGVEVKQIEI